MGIHTLETFFDGGLQVRQRRSGFRFSLDAVLLAGFVDPREGENIVELGAGCGIVSLILAYRHSGITVCGVEIQKALADLATRNVIANGLQGRVEIVADDMKTVSLDSVRGPADRVVCNPPFRKLSSGRISPDEEKAVARHEIRVTLKEMLAAAQRLLKPSGRLVAIYPAERSVELAGAMGSAGIEVKRMRWVHSRRESNAGRVLVEGVRGGRPGVSVQPPLIVWSEDGLHTREAAALFEP